LFFWARFFAQGIFILHFLELDQGLGNFCEKALFSGKNTRRESRQNSATKSSPRESEREREREQHISRHARTNEGITDKDTSLLFFFFFFFFFFCVVSRASQNEARSDDVSSPSSSFLRSRIFVLSD
jgi:hypothetical protein